MSDSVAPRLDRIVLGIDFSAPSTAAARWVAGALAPRAELVLVHALDTAAPPSLPEPRRSPSDAMLRVARDFAEARLRELAAELGRPDARVELPAGRPSVAITTIAEDCGADLIVVGPHGERAAPWSGLGTTAERLIRVSPIPVLLGTRTPGGPPDGLLVAVDDVDLTTAVLEWADALARRFAARVILLHVLDAGPAEPAEAAAASAAGGRRTGSSHDTAHALARAWLAPLARELPSAEGVELGIATGAPGPEILAAAARTGADLIVMGRRGAGRALPGAIGSSASIVLRGAECPVLVVVDPADAIIDDQ